MPSPLKVAIAADGRHAYEVAACARINPSALSHIISGKRQASPAVRERLAVVLGRPEEDLFPPSGIEAAVARLLRERAEQGFGEVPDGLLDKVSALIHQEAG